MYAETAWILSGRIWNCQSQVRAPLSWKTLHKISEEQWRLKRTSRVEVSFVRVRKMLPTDRTHSSSSSFWKDVLKIFKRPWDCFGLEPQLTHTSTESIVAVALWKTLVRPVSEGFAWVPVSGSAELSWLNINVWQICIMTAWMIYLFASTKRMDKTNER